VKSREAEHRNVFRVQLNALSKRPFAEWTC
jgi:hypothetical protein